MKRRGRAKRRWKGWKMEEIRRTQRRMKEERGRVEGALL